VRATVPGGAPDNLDLGLLDPSRDAWQEIGESTWQQADGTYVAQFQPRVTDQNKDSEFKVRVRSRLVGCAPSAWTDAGSFTPSDPFADSKWVGNWDAAQLSGSLSVNRTDLTGASQLTPSSVTVDGAVSHSLAFKADGTLTEDFAFTLASPDKNAPFAGCALKLHYAGTWSWLFSGTIANVVLSERIPAADPINGSRCAFPAPTDLAFADAAQHASLVIPPSLLTPSIDYSGLLSTPAAPVTFDNSPLSADLAVVLDQLSYASAKQSGSVSGDLTPVLGVYEKQ
jgi:hypothetical protein